MANEETRTTDKIIERESDKLDETGQKKKGGGDSSNKVCGSSMPAAAELVSGLPLTLTGSEVALGPFRDRRSQRTDHLAGDLSLAG